MSLSLLPIIVPSLAEHRFRSDDLDEVRAFIRGTDGEHSRVVRGRGALGFEVASLRADAAAIGWVRMGLGQTVRGNIREPALHLPIDQQITYRFGRRMEVVGPRTVMFVAPGWEFTRESTPGAMVALSVSGGALTREISARRPDAGGSWTFTARALTSSHLRDEGLADSMVDLARSLNPSAERVRPAHSEARVISALADVLLREAAVGPVALMTARRFADLEDWIEAHLAEPITLGQLCEVAGVGDRSLQLTFNSMRGMSPMRFVEERRLTAVHRSLRASGPAGNVTSVAIWYGFSHLGRFAAEYRRAFGESPSQTLRGSARPPPPRHNGTLRTP